MSDTTTDATKIEIDIPIEAEGVSCGFVLSGSPPYLSAYWWLSPEDGVESIQAEDPSCENTVDAAEIAIEGLKRISAENVDMNVRGSVEFDLEAFRLAIAQGKVPELAEDYQPEPTEAEPTDALPSIDCPLTEADELADRRKFEAKLLHLYSSVESERKIVTSATGFVSEAKAALKDAKESLSIEQAALNECVASRKKGGCRNPLFDKYATDEASDATEAEPADEPWRDVTIEDMGLPSGICEKLINNPEMPILTAGDIGEWINKLGKRGDHNPIESIPGIGKAARTNIDDAMLIVMQAYPPANEGPLKDGE